MFIISPGVLNQKLFVGTEVGLVMIEEKERPGKSSEPSSIRILGLCPKGERARLEIEIVLNDGTVVGPLFLNFRHTDKKTNIITFTHGPPDATIKLMLSRYEFDENWIQFKEVSEK